MHSALVNHRSATPTCGASRWPGGCVANNPDRKSGHVLRGDDGRIWGIDHGLCFSAAFKLRTVIWDFAGETVPESLLADIAPLAENLPPS